MTETITLGRDDLATINSQLEGLQAKIKAGEYILDATQDGQVENRETVGRTSHYTDRTKLTVTVTPAATNTEASIKSMTFEYKHELYGSVGCWERSERGTVIERFSIETAAGRTYKYGPEIRDIDNFDDETAQLRNMRYLGLRNVEHKQIEASNAAYRAQQQTAANRTDTIKSDVKI